MKANFEIIVRMEIFFYEDELEELNKLIKDLQNLGFDLIKIQETKYTKNFRNKKLFEIKIKCKFFEKNFYKLCFSETNPKTIIQFLENLKTELKLSL